MPGGPCFQPPSRSATGNQQAQQSYKFGMALEDHTSSDDRGLSFKRGDLIEDIKVFTHESVNKFEGRIRSWCGEFPEKSVLCISRRTDQEVLEQFSSQDLLDKAVSEGGWAFAQKLFSERKDDPAEPQLTTAVTSLGTTYVNRYGQLHDQALHFAVIAADHEMLRFLVKEHFVDVNKRADFPAMCSRFQKDDRINWEAYIETRSGTPLTVAINRYVRSKHLGHQMDWRGEQIKWRNVILELVALGAKWLLFATGENLLGLQPALWADGSTVLSRAIEYDDRLVYDSVLNAEPTLGLERLPWHLFLESEWWRVQHPGWIQPLEGREAGRTIEILRRHPQLADAASERSLKNAINELLWDHLKNLTFSRDRINHLFARVMAQIGDRSFHESKEALRPVAKQLEKVLKAHPDVKLWAEQRNYPSVLHFCITEDLCDALKVFLHGLSDKIVLPLINLAFDDNETPLDKAKANGNQEMVDLLKSYNAVPSQRTPQRSPMRGFNDSSTLSPGIPRGFRAGSTASTAKNSQRRTSSVKSNLFSPTTSERSYATRHSKEPTRHFTTSGRASQQLNPAHHYHHYPSHKQQQHHHHHHHHHHPHSSSDHPQTPPENDLPFKNAQEATQTRTEAVGNDDLIDFSRYSDSASPWVKQDTDTAVDSVSEINLSWKAEDPTALKSWAEIAAPVAGQEGKTTKVMNLRSQMTLRKDSKAQVQNEHATQRGRGRGGSRGGGRGRGRGRERGGLDRLSTSPNNHGQRIKQ
ncbi:MAG: hypothetical protein Q9227_004889 [Pyrenula ochraceoflavens]